MSDSILIVDELQAEVYNAALDFWEIECGYRLGVVPRKIRDESLQALCNRADELAAERDGKPPRLWP